MTTFICLFTPISVIDLDGAFNNQNAIIFEINIDDVHPGASSMFTYVFDNTMDFEIDLYLVKVETTNNNELTKNIDLTIAQSSSAFEPLGTQRNIFIATIDKGERVNVNFAFAIDPRIGNEIQGLSETYRFEFRVFNDDLELPETGKPEVIQPKPLPPKLILPNTGLQGENRWMILGIGALLLGIAFLIKGRDGENDET